MNNNRITANAFTLTDILMSLFIISAIIGVIFFIFSILSKQLLDYKMINEPVNELNRFSYLLNKDIFESERLDKQPYGMVFYFSDKNHVYWNIDNKYAIRLKDTLKTPINTIKIDTVKDLSGRYTFQRLNFEINFTNNPIEMKFYKRLYPDKLLTYEY